MLSVGVKGLHEVFHFDFTFFKFFSNTKGKINLINHLLYFLQFFQVLAENQSKKDDSELLYTKDNVRLNNILMTSIKKGFRLIIL